MTWLRIDDSFGDHPKLLELSRQDRWTFVELLTYCARHNTEGFLPENLHESRRYITAGFLRKCLAAGLLDDTESGLCVHDWKVFNPGKDATGAVRQSRWRNAHRNGSRNGAVTENVTGDITPSRARGPSRPLKPSSNNGSLDAADADEHTQLERLNTLLAQAAIEDMGP